MAKREYVLEKKELSKSLSWEGFKFGELIRRNKTNIKAIVSLLSGVLAIKYGDTASMSALFGAGGGIVTKMVLDSIDFYFSDVNLKK